MKLLIVCSRNSGRIAPFIDEQVIALQLQGSLTEFFLVQQKGIVGYLKERKNLFKKIKSFRPDLIHAHYGLSGLLANLQRQIPVVTTYHGSDINNPKVFPFSKLCMMLSAQNIFVSKKNLHKSNLQLLSTHWVTQSHTVSRKNSLIPCGVDIELFKSVEKSTARKLLGLDEDKHYVLFSGSFHNAVKNPKLALKAINLVENAELIELKGYTREQVVLLMNAVDGVLMTSFSEGSPQFIKEAMACNCPIVSVAVGDVPDVTKDIEGCYITTYEPSDVAEKLILAFDFGKRTEGRKRIVELGLDSETVAKKILDVYNKTIN
ncbi:MAG: glycosyltransferase [Paludibacter sp.]